MRATLRRLRQEKRDRSRIIKLWSAHLRGGVWLLASKYARHRSETELPIHLVQTRLRRGKRNFRAATWRFFFALVPPWVVLVRNANAPRQCQVLERGSLALAQPSGASALLAFAPRADSVLRLGGTVSDQSPLREVYSEYFRVPEVSALQCGCGTRESLLRGQRLTVLPLNRRLAVLDNVVSSYVCLIRNELSGSAYDSVADSFSRFTDLGLDIVGGFTDRSRQIHMRAKDWPLVVSHGDLSPQNMVIITESEFSVIDMESVASAPFFMDVVTLLLRDSVEFVARPDSSMMSVLGESGLRQALQPLWLAAGLSLGDEDLLNLFLAVMVTFETSGCRPEVSGTRARKHWRSVLDALG